MVRGDIYIVADREGESMYEAPAASLAVARAQGFALNCEESATFSVARSSLFGADVTLYVVHRDEDGTVWTSELTRED